MATAIGSVRTHAGRLIAAIERLNVRAVGVDGMRDCLALADAAQKVLGGDRDRLNAHERELVHGGLRIGAIKALRGRTGHSPKDAKAIVDQYR